MYKVIFACIHNAGPSQMAAAFFNQIAHVQKASAISAGTNPAERMHPEVVSVMKEMGIDLSLATPERLTEELAAGAQLLITMGCGEQCPFVSGLRQEDWDLPDPRGQSLETVRSIRDEVRRRVERLVEEEGMGR